jgi:hypothetical protein
MTIGFGYRPALIMTPLAVGSASARCGTTLLPMTHQGFREAQRRIATVDSSGRLILMYLNLNDEDLRTLQRTLGALTSLTMLDLSGNQLSTLPESLGALTSLTYLYLNANQLSTLPEGLARLAVLKTLSNATADPLQPEVVATTPYD